MATPISIYGLLLPASLLSAIEDEERRNSIPQAAWYSVFPRKEVARPLLNSVETIRTVNEQWRVERDPVYVGTADGVCDPGRLDPSQSVLIGELQPDALIALDYCGQGNSPSVVYLNSDSPAHWARVSPDVEHFLRALTLIP